MTARTGTCILSNDRPCPLIPARQLHRWDRLNYWTTGLLLHSWRALRRAVRLRPDSKVRGTLLSAVMARWGLPPPEVTTGHGSGTEENPGKNCFTDLLS